MRGRQGGEQRAAAGVLYSLTARRHTHLLMFVNCCAPAGAAAGFAFAAGRGAAAAGVAPFTPAACDTQRQQQHRMICGHYCQKAGTKSEAVSPGWLASLANCDSCCCCCCCCFPCWRVLSEVQLPLTVNKSGKAHSKQPLLLTHPHVPAEQHPRSGNLSCKRHTAALQAVWTYRPTPRNQ